jgi:hypothetical protein
MTSSSWLEDSKERIQLAAVPQAPGDVADEKVPGEIEVLQAAAAGTAQLAGDGAAEAVGG